jgi:subtilisin family serine protease
LEIGTNSGGTNDADIDAPEAWDICTGSSSVIIAILDSGIAYNHPDLQANIWTNSAEILDNVDNDGNGYIDDVRGWDFADNDNDPADAASHGTAVAGIAGASGNNSIGIAGVCWNVKLMPVKIGNAVQMEFSLSQPPGILIWTTYANFLLQAREEASPEEEFHLHLALISIKRHICQLALTSITSSLSWRRIVATT